MQSLVTSPFQLIKDEKYSVLEALHGAGFKQVDLSVLNENRDLSRSTSGQDCFIISL